MLRARKGIISLFGLRESSRGCTIENDLILQYWVVFDRTTPGLWRSPNGEIIPLRALKRAKGFMHGGITQANQDCTVSSAQY